MTTLAQDLFTQAQDLPPAERDAFLAESCGDNAELRLEVQRLLVDAEKAQSFFADTEGATIGAEEFGDTFTEAEGDVIGPYTLRQQIGEGGFGTVWMAEQSVPISRMVALKVIKAGMDTKQVLARFEAERQAVAMMDHPNIAKVLDAGATSTGRPFFAMELVKGIPITEFCNQQNFDPRRRLELFKDVCSAVQHAHQKGIIHRDLKPSNIMVTLAADVPVVKVIDFGIAKATQNKLTDKTLFTRFDQFLGTPVYMSPEQAAMSAIDIDTRSDIYSLGVLLYELLAGAPPFDQKSLLSAGYDEMRRIIAEEEPPKPSTRCTETQANPATTTGSKGKKLTINPTALKGDLDWIVMKAIEKDRTRRYETANAFAADIGRYLSDEPVLAAAPGAGYKFKKFARRNKTAFGVAAAMLVLLLVGIATTSWQAVRATAEQKLAEEERDRANAAEQLAAKRLTESEKARKEAEGVSAFLTGMFESSRPGEGKGGREVKVADVLDRAAKKLEIELTDQPERRAKLQATLGSTYFALGLYAQAIALQEKVRDYFLATHGAEHPSTIDATVSLARSYHFAGRREEALRMREDALASSRTVNGAEHKITLWAMENLANSYHDMGRFREAIELQEKELEIRRRRFGTNHPDTIEAMNALCSSFGSVGRVKEALKVGEEALSLSQSILGTESILTLGLMTNLTLGYAGDQRLTEAIKMAETSLPINRRVFGLMHDQVLGNMGNLALLYTKVGRLDEAIEMLEETLALSRKKRGPEHLESLGPMMNLADAYRIADRLDEAIKMQEETIVISRKKLGPEHPDTLGSMTNLAISYGRADRLDEAVALQEEVLVLKRRVLPPGHPHFAIALDHMAQLYEKTGRMDEALKLREEIVVLSRKVRGPEHPNTLRVMNNLATSYDDAGRNDEAIKMREEVLALHRKALGPEHPHTLGAMTNLAISYLDAGRLSEAVALQEEALALKRRVLPPSHPFFAVALGNMASCYEKSGRKEDAAKLRAELKALKEKDLPEVRSVMVAPGSEWKWRHPTDGFDPKESDPDFHQTFSDPTFDDSAWQAGKDSEEPTGGFGYGDDWFTGIDIGTPASKEIGKSAYFRHRFTTTKEHTHLELRCQRDDGLILYLDGKEVARDNMTEGEEAYALPAANTVSNQGETATCRIPLGDLTLPPGEHVLAISLHNTERPSSDLRIGGITLVEVGNPEAK